MATQRMIIASMVILFWGIDSKGDEAEHRAIAIIDKLNGEIIRDDTKPAKPVIEVTLARREFTDSMYKELTAFKKLTTLNINNANVTDKSLKEVAKLTGLKVLKIAGNNITDLGLKELVKLKDLSELNLDYTNVTDEGIAELKKTIPKCNVSHSK